MNEDRETIIHDKSEDVSKELGDAVNELMQVCLKHGLFSHRDIGCLMRFQFDFVLMTSGIFVDNTVIGKLIPDDSGEMTIPKEKLQ